jgi:hypothetical protein
MSKIDLGLSAETMRLLAEDRDSVADALSAEATRIATMTPAEFAARGIEVDASGDVLAGRLAKAQLHSIEFDAGKPGWRVNGRGYERYVSDDEARNILEGKR